MKARFRSALTGLDDTFWLLPGVMVLGGILLGVAMVAVDRSGVVPQWLIDNPWLYNGGGTGARLATATGGARVSDWDLEFAVRQLVGVGVRALSAGINDPHTAMSVLDRLGAALCDAAPLHLASGVSVLDDRVVLVVPAIDYGGLTDAMFHMLRQNATGNTAVLANQLDVLTAVAGCERDQVRLAELQRHADLVLGVAARDVASPADVDDVRTRHRRLAAVRKHGTLLLQDGAA